MKTKPGSLTEFANLLMWICGVVVFSIVVRQGAGGRRVPRRFQSILRQGRHRHERQPDAVCRRSGVRLFASPNEITVFDFPHDRIVLLDPNRRLRTELTIEKLNEFTDQLRARANRQTEALLKFFRKPKI